MEDIPSHQTSLALYNNLYRHVVGTEETVKAKRLFNTIRDNSNHNEYEIEITSGSFGEGLELKGSDLDIMYVLKGINVYEDIQAIQYNPSETSLVMELEDTKPGFTQLRLVNNNSKHIPLTSMCVQVGSDLYLSNQLFKSVFGNRCYNQHTSFDVIHGPCISDTRGIFDLAYCLHSRSWINPAYQWIKRPHTSWPSSEIKSRIIDHGILFVPIGNKGSINEELEWRISFSVGEKLLIYSFNHTQLLCYALMKILHKDVIELDKRCKDLLCSYFLKTIIFWISEELSFSVWKPENIIPCFLRCFKRLVYCVKYSVCPLYFIPENNLFENKIKGIEREFLLQTLYLLYSYGWQCVLLSEQFSFFQYEPQQMNNNLQPFVDYAGQIMCSKVLDVSGSYIFNQCQYAVKCYVSFRSSKIKKFVLYHLSIIAGGKAQSIPLTNIHRNKDRYKQYKKCRSFLLQSLHHDAVSGWLMVASFFYQMKQYIKALDILSYSLSKCTPEKVYNEETLSNIRYKLLTLKTFESIGLVGILQVLRLNRVIFMKKSALVPKELQEVYDVPFLIPPAVFSHFLRFLCNYHLNNRRQYMSSLTDLQLTITENYFIADYKDKLQAYVCLGLVLKLLADYKAVIRAMEKAIKVVKEQKCLQRHQIMGMT